MKAVLEEMRHRYRVMPTQYEGDGDTPEAA
jgi:hypothetical protein